MYYIHLHYVKHIGKLTFRQQDKCIADSSIVASKITNEKKLKPNKSVYERVSMKNAAQKSRK